MHQNAFGDPALPGSTAEASPDLLNGFKRQGRGPTEVGAPRRLRGKKKGDRGRKRERKKGTDGPLVISV